jgi:COP9 signalosome complex subunit 1
MASAAENSLLFQELDSGGRIIVREIPKMDLDSYISNYDGIFNAYTYSCCSLADPIQGPTRFLRLQTIATTSPFLSADAFRLAITEAMAGKNVDAYVETVAAFEKLLPNDPMAQLDATWIENKTKKVKAETDRMEHELKTYKNNLIKESIRVLSTYQSRMSLIY